MRILRRHRDDRLTVLLAVFVAVLRIVGVLSNRGDNGQMWQNNCLLLGFLFAVCFSFVELIAPVLYGKSVWMMNLRIQYKVLSIIVFSIVNNVYWRFRSMKNVHSIYSHRRIFLKAFFVNFLSFFMETSVSLKKKSREVYEKTNRKCEKLNSSTKLNIFTSKTLFFPR